MYCNQIIYGKRFYILTIGFMTSIARVFIISKKKSDSYLEFWFLLKSYLIILRMIVPIGLEETYN